MFRPFSIFLIAAYACTSAEAQSPITLTKPEPAKLEVRRGQSGPALVTCVTTDTHARPYLHPLRSPDGKGILTEFSPGHHKHQTGLYWGPTRINGRDYFHHYDQTYWANTKVTQATNTLDPGAHNGAWFTTSDLLDTNGKPVLQERQFWTIHAREEFYTLDLDWTGAAVQDVTIEKYPYGGLFLRMPWKPGIPASCINSEGDQNQAGEGKSARWVDLAMKIEGLDAMGHIAIIDHPNNTGYPALWRIDDQFGIGPAIARGGDIVIPKGETARYRYRLVIYQGDFDKKMVEEESKRFGAR